MLNLRKKAEYTYSAQLLAEMTRGLDRVSMNFTVDGAEAVVNFQGEGMESQQYHIRITPMSSIESRQEEAGERGSYSWGPEGPPSGIINAVRLNMKKTAQWEEDDSNEPWEHKSWRPQLTPKELEREFKELEPDFGKGMWGILNPYWEEMDPIIPPNILLRALDSGKAVILKYKGEYTIHLLNEFLGEDMYIEPDQASIVHLVDSGKLHEISTDKYDVWTSDQAFDYVNKFLANMHQDLPESTHEEKFDLPENLPPGIAVRLNMKKSTI